MVQAAPDGDILWRRQREDPCIDVSGHVGHPLHLDQGFFEKLSTLWAFQSRHAASSSS